MCSWHAPRAIIAYLSDHNQWVWHTKHSELCYNDRDRERGWDITFLDSEWIGVRNEDFEEEFCIKMRNRYKGLEGEELQTNIREAGGKKQLCVAEKEVRQGIVDIYETHLRWHPLTHLPDGAWDFSKESIKQVWIEQTTEMYEACKAYGQSWAWEYLWKNWYCPNRWIIWARAVCNEVFNLSSFPILMVRCQSSTLMRLLKAFGVFSRGKIFESMLALNSNSSSIY